jgi:hypothetical protein
VEGAISATAKAFFIYPQVRVVHSQFFLRWAVPHNSTFRAQHSLKDQVLRPKSKSP